MNSLQQPTRLFDCLTYRLKNSPAPDFLAAKENGVWRKYSTSEVREKVDGLSAGLLKKGFSGGDGSIEGRDKIGIISANCPEWIMADMAIQQTGAVSVPVYPNITNKELQFILSDANVKMIFVGDESLFTKVSEIKKNLPALEAVYSFKEIAGVSPWTELLEELNPEKEQQINDHRDAVNETDLVTILYTSGTTGTPKGVMLSHKNILSNSFGAAEVIADVKVQGERALSFLPLNHAFERMATYCLLYSGASIYYAESMDKLAENLGEVKPKIFTTVPRLLEKVYEGILAKGNELTGVKKKLFFWALGLAERFKIDKPLSMSYKIQLKIADKLIFIKWRDALGGEIKSIITGAAACQVRLLRIFTAAGIVIQEGYGLTEAAPIISGNYYDKKDRKFGTVGPPMNNVAVKIAEDGEVLCKGPNVMLGYYKRPDLTKEVMIDGWLRTGDIGTFVDEKFLKITDRKKELLKTSGGKFVAPQPIENKMSESPWIEQIMVVGEMQKFVSALIVPAFQAFKKWYAEQEKPYPGDDAILKDNEARRLIKESVTEYNREFNPVEQIKEFRLLPQEWTIEGGELTPTLKLKRKKIGEKYQEYISSIYS
ncbi:AMP-dependent synthetase [Salinimicrobium marinum]|uniref:AMP-dependent synthetase n=1 Tax=Salinimicrobium marinum TaxID=680283 RepID=A0A918SKJ1_9FLAO|nr:long-chain fatty acid--CoA ligase [Salinimicrobium marinum]GHA45751.1 AMP-dependent synthetase [Salinimicrobium marinum]